MFQHRHACGFHPIRPRKPDDASVQRRHDSPRNVYRHHAFATEGTAELQSETTLAQELNLSSAQVEQIKGLREQATRSCSTKLDAIGQDVIVNMIKSGKWDEVAAEKQLQTISDVQAEARYHRAHYLFPR